MTTTGTPVQERTVEVGPVTARVLTAGTGSPLLYLHGVDGLTWDPFLDGLAASHTVYAVRHPGSGEADDLSHLPGIWELVLFYDELLDALGLERVTVVGHSFGGMVAAELAANAPRRVDRLVLIAPLGLWLDEHPVPDLAGIPPEELTRLALADPSGPLAGALTVPADDPRARFEAAMRMASILHFVWPIPDKGLDRRIHRVAAPTLLVWGAQDRLVHPAYADAFAARLRDARPVIVPDAGHLPQRENPEPVAGAVREFLDDGAG